MGLPSLRHHAIQPWVLAACILVPSVAWSADKANIDILHVGTSGNLGLGDEGSKATSAFTTMQGFVKAQTGLNNDIQRQKDWRQLVDKMVSGELHLGVFQGYEFAWAKEKNPKFNPLVLAVNVYRYPTGYIVVRNDDPAKDVTGLKGHTLAIPTDNSSFLRLFVDRQAQANGKAADEFFSKITSANNIEDALDDLVDGIVQTVAVDRAGLESYKRRKPGRFIRVKEIVHSQPFPPVVVAYYNTVLQSATLERFRDGLINASRREGGKELLILLRLTSFDPIPEDFDHVLAETRKAYPPDESAK